MPSRACWPGGHACGNDAPKMGWSRSWGRTCDQAAVPHLLTSLCRGGAILGRGAVPGCRPSSARSSCVGVRLGSVFGVLGLGGGEAQPTGEADPGGEGLEPRAATTSRFDDGTFGRAARMRRRSAGPDEIGPADTTARTSVAGTALAAAALANHLALALVLDLFRSLGSQFGRDDRTEHAVIFIGFLRARRHLCDQRNGSKNGDHRPHGNLLTRICQCENRASVRRACQCARAPAWLHARLQNLGCTF